MILWPEERSTATPPSGISSEAWGASNRELSALTSAHAGPWSLDMIPFFRPVLAALDDDSIELVCIQKATQIAGSETVLTWLGKVAAEDPGPAMIVFADEDTAREFCKRRIQPMFRSSPLLSSLIIEADFGMESIILKNGFSLTMAWASSIARTASRPIRYLVADEITKPSYGQTGAEGSVLSRIFQRVETFPNRKIVMLSSVTEEGDNMDKQMQLCHVVYDWAVPCPDCGALQVLTFFPAEKDGAGKVWFPEGATAQERAAQARYQCKECKSLWTTAQKNAAVARGAAVPRGVVPAKPKRVGFCVSRLLSFFPGGRLEALAESFLMAKKDVSELQSLYNNALALHWKTTRAASTDAEVEQAKSDHLAGIVPPAADCLIATVDMQQSGFWFVVRAWASGIKDSWLVECGRLSSWDDVSDLFFERTWAKEDGEAMGVWRGGLDIGGSREDGKAVSRTEEAYEWWLASWHLARRRIYLCKGSSRNLPDKINIGKDLEITPSGKKIDRYGLHIIEMNTRLLKNLFHHGLKQAKERGSQAAYLPKDIDPQYARHITAEVTDENGDYQKIRPDNHWLDCEMMQHGLIARALLGGLDALNRALAATRKTAPKPQEEPKKQDETGENPAGTAPQTPQKPPEPEPKQAETRRKMVQNPWTRGTRYG